MLQSLVLASVLALGAAAQSLIGILDSLPATFPAACQSQCTYVKAMGGTCKDLDGDGSCMNDVCGNTDKFKTCLDCMKDSDTYDSILSVCAYLDKTGVDDSPVSYLGPSPTGEYTLDLSETASNAPLPVVATPKAGDDRAAAPSSAPASGDKSGAGVIRVSVGAVAAGAVVVACF